MAVEAQKGISFQKIFRWKSLQKRFQQRWPLVECERHRGRPYTIVLPSSVHEVKSKPQNKKANRWLYQWLFLHKSIWPQQYVKPRLLQKCIIPNVRHWSPWRQHPVQRQERVFVWRSFESNFLQVWKQDKHQGILKRERCSKQIILKLKTWKESFLRSIIREESAVWTKV